MLGTENVLCPTHLEFSGILQIFLIKVTTLTKQLLRIKKGTGIEIKKRMKPPIN